MRRIAAIAFGLTLLAGCGGSDSGTVEDQDATSDETGDSVSADGSDDTATVDDTGGSDDGGGTDSSGGDSTVGDSTTGDSSTTDAVVTDSAKTDGAATDSAKSDGASGDGGGAKPTVTITLPTAGAAFAFTSSDACQGQNFHVTYTAPAGFAEMKWRFITPNASTGVTGTCNGLAAYGYFMDSAKYAGSTSGSFNENVAIAGLFTDATANGRWWWCTRPGTSTESFVSITAPPTSTAPGAPGSLGYQTLSNYCYSNTKGAVPTDVAQQWTFEVTLKDSGGNTVVATQKFWVHN